MINFSVLAISYFCSAVEPIVPKFYYELNTPAVLELVPRCHLGPQTRKIEIWHPKLVKLCHLGP